MWINILFIALLIFASVDQYAVASTRVIIPGYEELPLDEAKREGLTVETQIDDYIAEFVFDPALWKRCEIEDVIVFQIESDDRIRITASIAAKNGMYRFFVSKDWLPHTGFSIECQSNNSESITYRYTIRGLE